MAREGAAALVDELAAPAAASCCFDGDEGARCGWPAAVDGNGSVRKRRAGAESAGDAVGLVVEANRIAAPGTGFGLEPPPLFRPGPRKIDGGAVEDSGGCGAAPLGAAPLGAAPFGAAPSVARPRFARYSRFRADIIVKPLRVSSLVWVAPIYVA